MSSRLNDPILQLARRNAGASRVVTTATTPLTVFYRHKQKMCSKCQVRATHWQFDFIGVRFRVCHHCMNPLEQAAMNLIKMTDSRPKGEVA